jgi:diguanylate cyclase (GGDEF)-like protein
MLIASCYLYMGYASHGTDIFTPKIFTTLMANFSPFLLVAYVTSMLAEDVHHAKREITVQSQTDELTGLLNMRAFAIILGKEIATAGRYLHPVTLIMIDVDKLKYFNDQFGHGAGSRLLKTVAGSINDCIRASDVLARYGGDEFVVLMPHTGSKAARFAAERIREAIHTSLIEVNGERIAATASLGIASYPEGVDDVSDILEKADVALYKSKQSGRNRVTYYRKDFDVIRLLPESNPAVIPHPSAAVS